jgi:RHS repeat-associated protein
MTAATYDGSGLRTSAASTPTGGGSSTQNFVWDTTSSVPHVLMDSTNAYLYGPNGTPFEQVNLSTGVITYLVGDTLGSVRGVVSATGSLTASTSYDAWGNPEATGGLSAETPIGFAGGYTDPSGLVYLIGRYYDPATGQFLNVDPLVDETGQAYAYTGDDPVNSTDPIGAISAGQICGMDGLKSQACTGAIQISAQVGKEVAANQVSGCSPIIDIAGTIGSFVAQHKVAFEIGGGILLGVVSFGLGTVAVAGIGTAIVSGEALSAGAVVAGVGATAAGAGGAAIDEGTCRHGSGGNQDLACAGLALNGAGALAGAAALLPVELPTAATLATVALRLGYVGLFADVVNALSNSDTK